MFWETLDKILSNKKRNDFPRPLNEGSNLKSKPDLLSAAYFGVYHTHSNRIIGNKVADLFSKEKDNHTTTKQEKLN